MTQTIAAPASASRIARATARTGPILVAVGHSDGDTVLRAARALSAASHGGVLAVTVLETLPVYAFGVEPMIVPPAFDEERRLGASRLLADRVRTAAGEDSGWRTNILYGDPSYVISDLARSLHSPLIVMGLGRHRPIDRLLSAETTLRTIRRAPCPVLAVHPHFAGSLHSVVIATDFSPASARAAELVLPMLPEAATLHLVHVWQPAATELASLAGIDHAYEQSLPDRFHRLESVLEQARGITVKEVTREGKPAERTLDYAKAHHADLIVAGRHGMSEFKRLLVGSVTKALVRGAECSVLVSPEPPFSETDRLRRLLTGASTSTDPVEWAVQLSAFSYRNRGRRTVVEIDDLAFGAQVIESGYVMIGVMYDRDQSRLVLALGDPDNSARQITRNISSVDSVSIATDPHGTDLGLRISHGGGETILTFTHDVRDGLGSAHFKRAGTSS